MILPDVDTPNTLGGYEAQTRNLVASGFRARVGRGSV